jgi:hypothetical protein
MVTVREQQRRPRTNETCPGAPDDLFAATDEPELVTVSHGIHLERLAVANRTVGEIRARFADRFDIDPRSRAQLDGREVDDRTVVRSGQVLMFIRHAGEKGHASIGPAVPDAPGHSIRRGNRDAKNR